MLGRNSILFFVLIMLSLQYCTPKELRGLGKEDKAKMKIVYRHNKGVRRGEDCYATKDMAREIEQKKKAEQDLSNASQRKAGRHFRLFRRNK